MLRWGLFLLSIVFCSSQARYIHTIHTLRNLKDSFMCLGEPVWITAVDSILLNCKTGKTMEPDTRESFNEFQKYVKGSVGVNCLFAQDSQIVSQGLHKSNLIFNSHEIENFNLENKSLYFENGVLHGDISQQSLIMSVLIALCRDRSFDIEECIITVPCEYQAVAISSFLVENYSSIDCDIIVCDFSKE